MVSTTCQKFEIITALDVLYCILALCFIPIFWSWSWWYLETEWKEIIVYSFKSNSCLQRYCCLTKYQEQAHYCLPTGSRVRGGNMWELNPQPSQVQGQHNQVHYVARNWINNNQLVNNEMLKKHTMTWSITTTVIVTEFKVRHQAHVHTEALPTLSTQYQILIMI